VVQGKKHLNESVSTGIDGLDEILSGGFPLGQATVIRGASGTGKTMFSLVFASPSNSKKEKTIFATFDESPERLKQHFEGWGRSGPAAFLDFRPDPQMETAGDGLELGGLIVRVQNAVKKTGAKRLILDGFDVLFSAYGDSAQIRRDMTKVFEWCRAQGLTVIVTTGEEASYRAATGPMDYAADCAIHLDQRIKDGLMTRILRVIKCRGRAHGTNEYPYLIDSDGISLLPVTEYRMEGTAPNKHMTTGIDWLDAMLGGKGYWADSSIMISGQSGTGKSLMAIIMADAVCRAGLKVLYNSFEESPKAIIRNSRSIGVDLRPHVKSGTLELASRRSVESGLEEHIIRIANSIRDTNPDIVILDPISSLRDIGNQHEFKGTVLRLSAMLNKLGVTAIMTELVPDDARGYSSLNVSSLVDTWIRLARVERDGLLERLITVQKSRGSKTSDRVEQFSINADGFRICRPVRQSRNKDEKKIGVSSSKSRRA